MAWAKARFAVARAHEPCPLPLRAAPNALFPAITDLEFDVETHGPLGTLWVSFGLIAFYIALIWLNTLLGVFLTPLFLIPGTWLMDKVKDRKARKLERQQQIQAGRPAARL